MSTTLFNVRDYGATGSGLVLDTSGVNDAIDNAAKVGGGTVYFPAGRYLCFSIHLRSNVNLYLAQGCTIIAADSPLPGQTTGQLGGAYDLAEPFTGPEYQDYGHCHWHNSLIWGESISNFGIGGPGLIDGKGLSDGSAPSGNRPGGQFNTEAPGVGNKSIALVNCRNVTLRDFSILQGGWFGLLLTGVDNMTIDNLKIDTNRDGMDIDCCDNVRVSNCTVNSPWDDAICLKSSYALGHLKLTENVTITNCTVTGCYELGTVLSGAFTKLGSNAAGMAGGIKCGTESNGGFQRITISNCVLEGCNGLSVQSVDGGICEDIVITKIAMRDVVTAPLFFRLGSRLRGPSGTMVGVMQRILVSNIVCSNSNPLHTNILSGIPGHRIEHVKIANFYMQQKGGGTIEQANLVPPEDEDGYPEPTAFGVMPAQGFFLRHIRGLEMSQVEIAAVAPDMRSSFVLDDVITSWWLGITAPNGIGSPVPGALPPFSAFGADFHIHASQAFSTDFDHLPLLTLFDDEHFAGLHKHWYGQGGTAPGDDDNAFLTDFNDITSSFIIHNGVWEFFADANFNTPYQHAGNIIQVGPGRYARMDVVFGPGSNDNLSSFRRVDGNVV